jgi:hypothetical protein
MEEADMSDDATVHEKALRFIAHTRSSLKNGVKHYSLDGRLLATELEIAEALQQDGRVELDETARVERFTFEAELALARAEFGAP